MDATLLAIGVDSSQVKTATNDLAGLTAQSKQTETENDRLVKSWQQQASELGKTRAEVMQMRAEQAGLSQSQMQSAQNAINAIAAYDKQQKMMSRLKVEAVALGVALAGVIHIGLELFNQFVEQADALDEWSEKLGISVEKLGGLKFAVEQNNGSFEDLTTWLRLASRNAAEAYAGSEDAAKGFNALGVSVTDSNGKLKGSAELLNDVATAVKQFKDGDAKIAVLDQIGRGGDKLIPLLNQGAEGIAALTDRYKELGAITDEETAAANEYNKTLASARTAMTAVVGQAATPLMEALTNIIKAMEDGNGAASEVAKTLGDVLAFGAKVAASAFVILSNALNQIGSLLGGVAQGVLAFFRGDFSEIPRIAEDAWKKVTDSAATADRQLDKIWSDLPKKQEEVNKGTKDLSDNLGKTKLSLSSLMETIKQYYDGLKQAVDLQQKLADRQTASQLLQLQIQLQTGLINQEQAIQQVAAVQAKADADAITSIKQKITYQQQEIAAQQAVAAANAKNSQQRQEADKNIKAAQMELAALEENLASAEQKQSDDRLKAAAQYVEYVQKAYDNVRQITQATEDWDKAQTDQIANQQRQLDLLGKTPTEIARANAEYAKQVELDAQILKLRRQLDDEERDNAPWEVQAETAKALDDVKSRYGGLVKSAGDLAAANVQVTQSLQDQRDVFNTLDGEAQNFFEDFLEHGTSAFKNVGDALKKWVIDALYQLVARQWIIQLTASITGGTAASVSNAAGLTGGAGGNPITSLLGALTGGGGSGGLGGITSLLGGGGGILGSIGGLIGGGFGAALGAGGSAGLATLGLASSAGLSSIGGIGSALGAAGAVLGSVLPIIGIGLAIASAFGAFGKGGGPKSGGFAQAGTDLATGQSVAGNFNRFFTPNDQDSKLNDAATTLVQQYSQIATALGATSGQVTFGIGFDTDPQGKAGSRVSAGATVNGQTVYSQHDIDVGRDDQALQDQLALQAKRALFAALQASDLPDYIGKIFDGIDAATASSDTIDQLLAEAQALKTAVDTISGLGDKFSSLDPDQIKSVIDAFGGIDQFSSAFQFIQANFTTGADKLKLAQDQLNKSFGDLNLAVPKTHQEFLDLLNSFDLTTDAGRQMYASVAALAPAFIAVNGTADDAAQAVEAQAEANKQLVQSAEDFYKANFFTEAEQQAQTLATDWQKVNDAQKQLGVTIPTTIDGFKQMIDGIDRSTDAGEALYEALIQLAPAVYDIATGAGKAATAITAATTALQGYVSVSEGQIQENAYTNVANAVQMITQLTDNLKGDTGDKLASNVSLIQEQINKYKALQTQYQKTYGMQSEEYQLTIQFLTQQQTSWKAQLAAFNDLKAQFGSDKADQLFDLQQWYAQQQQALQGNAQALATLAQIFNQKWTDIVNGTASGVDGTLDQLEKLADGIRDYLKSLKTSDLSVLSPLAKVQEAQQQFADELAKAQGGDTDAIQDITKYADSYLQLAKSAFASTPQYAQIFDTVYNQLSQLADLVGGTSGTGVGSTASGATSGTPQSPIDAAAPTDSPIFSQADGDQLRGTMEDVKDLLNSLLTKSIASTDAITTQSIDNTKKITTALGSKK